MRVVLSDDVITQPVSDELVLLDFASGQYFGLDAVGARMLELLLAHDDRPEVVRTLLEEFEVDAARLERDLDGLVAALVARGLVRPHAPPA